MMKIKITRCSIADSLLILMRLIALITISLPVAALQQRTLRLAGIDRCIVRQVHHLRSFDVEEESVPAPILRPLHLFNSLQMILPIHLHTAQSQLMLQCVLLTRTR